MPAHLPTAFARRASRSTVRARRAVGLRGAGAAACALLSAALLAGCGGPPDRNAPAGTTVMQDGVAYSVQISRELNPVEPDDRALLGGLAGNKALDGFGTTLVGVFLQARDDVAGPRRAVASPQLVSAFGEVFQPLPLAATNPFAYHGGRLAPAQEIPDPVSPAAEGPVDGAALIYQVPASTFTTDRPFTLRFGSNARAASVQLDL